ncbi:MAG TPA: hypothetical protein ENI61_00535 [Ignavibacteria bacterium]|nr:hypothetical protein [Ignavibacteria bacterium]
MSNEITQTNIDNRSGWKNTLSDNTFKNELIVTIIILIITLFLFTRFLNFVQSRQGVVLPDPILNLFRPINLTWIIFGLIYASIITAILSLANKPKLLVIAFQTYSLMLIFRFLAMYSIPLDPPMHMIVLKDPFVELFSNGSILTKDLFFSGHTATLFLLFLVVDNKILKYTLLVFTIIVGVCLLIQHVHYTVDVISAPFFSYASYRIAFLLNKKLHII